VSGSSASTAASATSGVPGPDASTGELFRRAEVRDVLAWVRLLVDPADASAVVRALARPPVELAQVDLARVIQIARRRKLDLVLGLATAIESPQIPPEARDRIRRFVALHRELMARLDATRPDDFLAELSKRLGAGGRALIGPDRDAAERAGMAQLRQLAHDFARDRPHATGRDLAVHLAGLVPRGPGARARADAEPQEPAGPQRDGDDALHEALALLRAELLDGVARIGGRLGELRLDTDLDISHGVVRYLELLKLSALIQRPPEQSLPEALADINARLLAAATPLQREILLTSTLDDALLREDCDEGARAHAIAPREGRSLGPFLPRKGVGLALSASDIGTYRSCPLRYKFARVLRIPSEQTIHQRFGIVVHQVLERYHADGGETLQQLLDLLDAGWQRSGLGYAEPERALKGKARDALTRYHARLSDQECEPVWFERQFSFSIGPHQLRGRVDRVDRLGPAEPERYELIDYKTSRPRTPEQLEDDVQLSLYALAARDAWQLESSRGAYYYVLDDAKVRVPAGDQRPDQVRDVVLEVADGILAEAFEPRPSPALCAGCEHRIVCPAAAA
jgi:RecB family exonuclease